MCRECTAILYEWQALVALTTLSHAVPAMPPAASDINSDLSCDDTAPYKASVPQGALGTTTGALSLWFRTAANRSTSTVGARYKTLVSIGAQLMARAWNE